MASVLHEGGAEAHRGGLFAPVAYGETKSITDRRHGLLRRKGIDEPVLPVGCVFKVSPIGHPQLISAASRVPIYM